MSVLQQLAAEEPVGTLETVATFDGPMPTGVTVSHRGQIFINFPRWGDDVAFTVGELRSGRAVAYPDEATNKTDPKNPAAALVSVQSVVVDPADRLWILDTTVRRNRTHPALTGSRSAPSAPGSTTVR